MDQDQGQEQAFKNEIEIDCLLALLNGLDKAHGEIYMQVILPKVGYMKDVKDKEKAIYGYVDQIMKELLRINLPRFKDPTLVRLLCKAFYGEAEEVKGTDQEIAGATADTWDKCQTPIFAALLVVYVSDQMKQVFQDAYELNWVDVFQKQKEKFDENAHDLFDLCYRDRTKSKSEAKNLLREGYYAENPPENSHSNSKNPVTFLLEIADRANTSKFLAHPFAQRFVEELWEKGSLEEEAPIFTPRRLFWIHGFFYLIFLVVYGIGLQYLHLIGKGFAGEENRWLIISGACGLLCWQATFIYETYAINGYGLSKYRIFDRYNFWQIWLLLFFFLIIFPCLLVIFLKPTIIEDKTELIVLYESFLYINFIYCSLQLLPILASLFFFDTIIITIERMFSTICRFFLLIIVFWLIYSVVQNSLLGTSWGWDSPWAMFIQHYDEAKARANDLWNSRKLRRTLFYQRAHFPPPFNFLVDMCSYCCCKRLRKGQMGGNNYCYGTLPTRDIKPKGFMVCLERLFNSFLGCSKRLGNMCSCCCCKESNCCEYGVVPPQDTSNLANDGEPDLRAVEVKHLNEMLKPRNTGNESNAEIDALKKEILSTIKELIKEIRVTFRNNHRHKNMHFLPKILTQIMQIMQILRK